MIRATTPTFTLTLPTTSTVDLTEADLVYFTISQGSYEITKEVTPIDAHTVEVDLTQEESLGFKDGRAADLQLNWLYDNGKRAATKVKSIVIDKQLYKEIMSEDGGNR